MDHSCCVSAFPSGNYPRGRDIALSQTDDATTNKPLTFQIEKKMWTDPVTISVSYGSVELWNLINPTGES